MPDPSPETDASSDGSISSPSKPLSASQSRCTGRHPAAPAAATRSSPSATKRDEPSRDRRRASLRISLSLSLCALVIVMSEKKGAVL